MSARGKIQRLVSFKYNGINFDVGTKDYLSIQIKDKWLDMSKAEAVKFLRDKSDNYIFYGIPKHYLISCINSVGER